MRKTVLSLKGEITTETIDKINFDEHGSNFLIISSIGGDFNTSIRICNKIRKIPNVKGYVDKNADYAAFTVLQCCKLRICKRKTTFTIHPVIVSEGELTISHLKAYYSVISVIAWRTKHPIPFLWELFRTEKTLTAEEALELNFIDKII
jgi:ATP-dependent protease ClpP protease subunit